MGKKRRRSRRAAAKSSSPTVAPSANSWIQDLAQSVRTTDRKNPATLRTALSCHISDNRQTLYLPPEMPALQPRSLRYLSAFAMRNDFQISEDRRQTPVSPIIEQRDSKPPVIAHGLALLMKQTGLPGATATLSSPHRLAAENPLIDLPDLIAMSAHSQRSAKRVVFLPNKSLVDVLDNDTKPIAGFGCRLDSRQTPTLLTNFEGESLRCIGYSTGDQYVMHMLLGGGPLSSPTLWTQPNTLTRTDIRFRLFRGREPSEDFGLLYSTFYYDMSQQTKAPWWLTARPNTADGAKTRLVAG